MGCQCIFHSSPSDTEEEEFLMTLCESRLGYTPHDVKKLWTQIRVLTINERLNWNRMRKFAGDWSLALPEPEEQSDPVAEFYRGMRKEEEWDARKVALLAILLGKGGGEDKAELVFGLYDREYGKVLGRKEVEEMASDLCTLALHQLPALSVSLLESQDNLDSAVLLQNYISKLHTAASACQTAIISLLLPTPMTDISYQTFHSKVTSEGLLFLISPRGIREETFRRYKSLLRAHAKHKPTHN